MSLKDFPTFDGSAEFANAASAGLSANNNNNNLLDEQQLFCNPDFFGNSPAVSFFSTPELGYLDTPDTVISHDFDLVYSPQLSKEGSHKSVDKYGALDRDPMFRDVTLFPSTAFDESTASTFNNTPDSTIGELFVDAASLELTPRVEHATLPSAPPSLSSASSFEMPPPRTKPNHFGKMQRPRKRQASEGDYAPHSILGKRSASSVDDEDDDVKAMLRAKNTEAAARSRARKKAAMEEAEKRIAELEAENASLKAQLALALKS